MAPFIPRMELFRYEELYHRVLRVVYDNYKVMTYQKIDLAFYCFDQIGRRLYSLTEIYQHQR